MDQQSDGLPNALEAQLERARFMVEDSYSKHLEDDAATLRFLLDRLERVEKAQSDAYNTIHGIDWAL